MIEFWIDPESPYHKDIFAQEGKKYVFHCASGWRSALTVATLQHYAVLKAHLKEPVILWSFEKTRRSGRAGIYTHAVKHYRKSGDVN